MPTVYPITWFPPTHRGHFPHMQKRDEEVWLRFLDAHAERFEAFAYDIALGGQTIEHPGAEPQDVKAWQYKTALKIDATGLREGEVHIIEVKPEAHVSALGAVVAYMLVMEREQAVAGTLRGAIVCEYAQPDVQWAAAQLSIAVYVV